MNTTDRISHYGDCPAGYFGRPSGRCTCPPPQPLHCSGCGTTSGEYVSHSVLAEGDGYTPCCNEPAADDCRSCTHEEPVR